jgi:hypothetical protein
MAKELQQAVAHFNLKEQGPSETVKVSEEEPEKAEAAV